MRWLRNNWLYVVLALIVAFAVHVASVALLPRAIMTITLSKLSAAHGFNTMVHTSRATSASRAVVRPSPDLLYSTCPFDLSKRPLRVSATGMPHTYWSVSVFDADTDNVYAINDRQAKDGSVNFIVQWRGGDTVDGIGGTPTVSVKSAHGLVLVRTLIDDDKHLAAIDAARRHVTCTPY